MLSMVAGQLYVTSDTGLRVVHFDRDVFRKISDTGNSVSGVTGSIAARNTAVSYSADAGLALVGPFISGVDARLYGNGAATRLYVAVANFETDFGTGMSETLPRIGFLDRLFGVQAARAAAVGGGPTGPVADGEIRLLINPLDGGASLNSSMISSRSYGDLVRYDDPVLTAGMNLYAADVTTATNQVARWDQVDADGSDQPTADRSWSSATTPALASGAIVSLAVSHTGSALDVTMDQISVGVNAAGVTMIDDAPVQSDSLVRQYVRSGESSTGWNPEGFGPVIRFDGSNDNIVVPDAVSLRPTDWTIETWVNPRSTANVFLTEKSEAATNINVTYRLQLVNGVPRCGFSRVGNAAFTVIDASAALTNNQWSHLACVYTDSTRTLQLFVNGQSVASTVSPLSPASSTAGTVKIGGATVLGSLNYFLNGSMDEVRISSTPRYTANFTPQRQAFAPDVNTALLYHFDADFGSEYVADDSAQSHLGTFGATASAASDDPMVQAAVLPGSSDTPRGLGYTTMRDPGYNQGYDSGLRYARSTVTTNLPTTNFTLTGWVQQYSSDVVYWPIMGFGTYCTANQWVSIGVLNGSPAASFCSGVDDMSAGAPGATWMHVALTVIGTTARLYRDGVLVQTKTLSTASNIGTTSGLWLGNNPTLDSFPEFSLDDLRVYNRQLTSYEVASIYGGGRAANGSSVDNGLVRGYRQNSETNDLDYSSNGAQLQSGSSMNGDPADPYANIGGPVRNWPVLWIATNDAAANDGGVVAVNTGNHRRVVSLTSSNSSLPDNDVNFLNMSTGGLALIGTQDGGAWAPTEYNNLDAGALALLNVGVDARAQVTGGTVRVRGGTVRVK
jgi:hypothetical protein